jgi:hypothetical protein
MTRPKHDVCTTIHHKKGDVFDWHNPHKSDCKLTNCDPPLTQGTFDVPAGHSVPATVRSDANVGDYPYDCSCGREPKTNPKIIIGSA